jgi:hypothetical protein
MSSKDSVQQQLVQLTRENPDISIPDLLEIIQLTNEPTTSTPAADEGAFTTRVSATETVLTQPKLHRDQALHRSSTGQLDHSPPEVPTLARSGACTYCVGGRERRSGCSLTKVGDVLLLRDHPTYKYDLFQRIGERQGRPMYKKRGKRRYLFYTAGGWFVGYDYSGGKSDAALLEAVRQRKPTRGWWRVVSTAETPCAITETWQTYDGAKWVEMPTAKIVKAAHE